MSNFEVDPSKQGTGNAQNPYDFGGVSQKPPPSSYQRNMLGSRANVGTAQQRLGTAMKANQSAGLLQRSPHRELPVK
jgi:hypothetical protein